MRLFKLAAYHRVLPALYAALQGRPEAPASIYSALRARYLRHCWRIMRSWAELEGILQHFEARGIPVDELFARSQEHEFDGCQARMLGLEDQLIFVCVHAAKHQWAHLGMARDIAAIAGFDLDWESVLHDARRLGIVRILLVSLLLAEELLGCELPERAAGLPERGAQIRRGDH